MGGAAFIFSHVAEPGVVEDTGGLGPIVFAEWEVWPGGHRSSAEGLGSLRERRRPEEPLWGG
jgi:hypothetical protein